MTTPVKGPDDVKPGDLVQVGASWKGNDRTGVATVVKATAAKLTVRWPDHSTSSRPYTRVEVHDTFRRQTRSTVANFDRLSAWDRWWHARPPTSEIDRVAVRDRPDDVCAQIRALSEWLKAEPSKGEP